MTAYCETCVAIGNEKVEADGGRVALQRGPLVYCFEWPDNPDGKVQNLLLKGDVPVLAEERLDLLGGLVALKTTGRSFARDEQGHCTWKDVELLAIPYYAWAHRGKSEMAVWIARGDSAGRIS